MPTTDPLTKLKAESTTNLFTERADLAANSPLADPLTEQADLAANSPSQTYTERADPAASSPSANPLTDQTDSAANSSAANPLTD